MKKRNIFLFLALAIILVQLSSVFADGGYIPYPGYWVRPGQQKAIIFYEDNTETMILTSNFQGDAKELVWLIPTPAKPTVTKANEEVFTNIQKIARPQYDRYAMSYGVMLEAATGARDTGVVVIESKQVDYYDVNVLLATSSQDLADWLNDNDYEYPEAYSYVLEHYIDKGWYFTAVKVSPEAQGATEVIQDLKEGHPTPLKMVFFTDKIVFPLKISSVNFEQGFKISPTLELTSKAISHLKEIGYDDLAEEDKAKKIFNQIVSDAQGGEDYEDSVASDYPLIVSKSQYDNIAKNYNTLENAFRSYFSRNGINLGYNYYGGDYIPINLYVIADGKYDATNFYTTYGNWINKAQIEDLGQDENGDPLIQPDNGRYFLTALNANMQRSQMDDDLFLKQADNNAKVNAGPEAWQVFLYGLLTFFVLLIVWVFTPLGILFIVGTLILFLTSNKTARIIAWIMEFFSLIMTFIIGIVFLYLVLFYGAPGHYIITSFFITLVFLLILMIVLMIVQKKHYPKSK